MIKLQRKYAESKAYVYGKSTVLYGNYFAPTVCVLV